MRWPRLLLLSSLACSSADPQDTEAATTACSENGDGCPRNGQTGSLGIADDHGMGSDYGVGLDCPAALTALEPHQETGLGFDAQALVDLVSGAHRESLLWLSNVAGAANTASDATGTQINVELELVGAAQLLTRTGQEVVPESAPPGAVPGAHCQTAVGLPVRVRLQSDDGALDASVETTLESSYGDFARLAFVLPAAALSGTHVLSGSDTELAVELGVTSLGVMGSLSVPSQPIPGDSSIRKLDQVAHFPAQRYCSPPERQYTDYDYTSRVYLAPDQAFRGISLENQLDRLNRASPVSARPIGKGPSRPLVLNFASSNDHLCLELESPSCDTELANISGSVRLSSDDGTVDGEIPLSWSVFGYSEQPAISTFVFGNAASLDEAPALVRSFGVQEAIDYTGRDGADVLFSASLDGAEFRGSLTVVGWRYAPSCAPEYAAMCKLYAPIWSLDWGKPVGYPDTSCPAPPPARE